MIDRASFLSPDGITFDGRRAVPNEAVTKLMLSLADLQPGEKVLEIGTGSGYQTQFISEAVGDEIVHTLDIEPGGSQLFNVTHCGDGNIMLWTRDGKRGLEKASPFDAIIVSCGMTSIPPAYEEQLREGGRLIIPMGQPDGQELLRLEKRNGKLVLGRCAGYVRFQMAS